MSTTIPIAVSAAAGFEDRAEDAARACSVPVSGDDDGGAPTGLRLHLDRQGWAVIDPAPGGTGIVRADFLAGQMGGRMRRAPQGESRLARALGLKRHPAPLVVDATAGLGRESVLAAALGCRVIACERSPIVALLLRDALDRAAAGGLGTIVERIDLRVADAREVLAALPAPPDVVIVDPMFPEAGKSAKARKEMQMLQRLLGPGDGDPDDGDGDAEALLASALAHARRRVVVKRPPHAPPLGGRRPDFEVPGRAARYDVYLVGA